MHFSDCYCCIINYPKFVVYSNSLISIKNSVDQECGHNRAEMIYIFCIMFGASDGNTQWLKATKTAECLKGPGAGKAEDEGLYFQIDFFFCTCKLMSLRMWSVRSLQRLRVCSIKTRFQEEPKRWCMVFANLTLDGNYRQSCHTLSYNIQSFPDQIGKDIDSTSKEKGVKNFCAIF